MSLLLFRTTLIVTSLYPCVLCSAAKLITDEALGTKFLNSLDAEATQLCVNRTLAEWIYATDLTATNRDNAAKETLEYSKFWKEKWKQSQLYDWDRFIDPKVRRQFKLLSTLGVSALPEDSLKTYNALRQKMESIFSTARICSPSDPNKCNLALEPEITELMMYSRNESELRSGWRQFHDATGRKMRKDYALMAKIMLKIAQVNEFSSFIKYETRSYELPQFQKSVDSLWTKLEPFYKELHAYVRFKLSHRHGPDVVHGQAPIPGHLLGNMWAQSWSNIFDIVAPFEMEGIDVTREMVKQKVTPTRMAVMAENFFVSLGFPPLPPEFWAGSVLEKPLDKEMVCHASSWDMCDQKNFWIKQCTRVNMEDLITLHHEMGHTMYQIQYQTKPKLFRNGPNPAFHEAIGDLIGLSVQTPQHLYKIGLLKKLQRSKEREVNHLMLMALDKIAFLPFALLVDKWRWNVVDGMISKDNYNCEWWDLRNKFQGVSPPEVRSETDFDPGSKYHVAANAPYIKYFISTIIQFQFHEALCKVAGKYDPSDVNKPLHKCDIYGSMAAGNKLRSMLQQGSSVPWPDAMEIVTGQRELVAQPILDYFRPLIDWLEIENKFNNVTAGWKQGRAVYKF